MARPKRLALNAVTKRNRFDVMAEIDDAAAGFGGWIAGHTLFSNIATTFQCVVPLRHVAPFGERLAALSLSLDGESKAQLTEQAGSTADPETEVNIALNVTFIHDEPDLRRDVPMVPG